MLQPLAIWRQIFGGKTAGRFFVKKNKFFPVFGTLVMAVALTLLVVGCDHSGGSDGEEVIFGETGAQVYDMDGEPFTGNYAVNVRFLNADGKKRDVKVGAIENGKLTFAIRQSFWPNNNEMMPYPVMPGITMMPSDLKVANWEFCLTGTDMTNATLGLECRKDDQSIMGSYGKSCQYFSSNVPAVCDGLTARIRALRSKDQGWQTVGGVWRGNGA
jgi:hypothetical protein